MRATDNREGQVPFFLLDMPTVLNLQPLEGPPEGAVPLPRASPVSNRGAAY